MNIRSIDALEQILHNERKSLALAWNQKWGGPGHVEWKLRCVTYATIELFKAYGDFEPEWKAYLFKKLT
jgi:hypothetical protein